MRPYLTCLLFGLLGCGLVGYDAPPSSVAIDGGGLDDGSTVDADPNAPDAAPAVCPDGTCTLGETCSVCPEDCAVTTAVCGNGVCDSGEGTDNCFDDCGPSPWPTGWANSEGQVLTLINERRSAGATCPGLGLTGPGPELTLSEGLLDVARNQSWDAARHNYDPVEVRCSGDTIFKLMDRAGFSDVQGAAMARGVLSPDAAVNFWMSDEVTCPLLMSPSFNLFAAGVADDTGLNYYTVTFYGI